MRVGVGMKVGDRVSFWRGREQCEGYCVIESIDPGTRQVALSPLPEGIEPGDYMTVESEMDLRGIEIEGLRGRS